MTLVAALGAVVVAAAAGWMFWPRGTAGVGGPIPAVAPAFSLPGVRPGSVPAVLMAPPGRPTVVSFFAAWCEPCRRELPALADLNRREGERLWVVGVDMADNRDLATALLEDSKVTFPAGYDPERKVSAAWGVDGLPVTFFVTADGQVAEAHRGELGRAALARSVRRLLSAAPVTTGPPVTGASLAHRQS